MNLDVPENTKSSVKSAKKQKNEVINVSDSDDFELINNSGIFVKANSLDAKIFSPKYCVEILRGTPVSRYHSDFRSSDPLKVTC